jgi:hypothetical protein
MNRYTFVYRASLVVQAILVWLACFLIIVVLLRPIGADFTRMDLEGAWSFITFALPLPIGILAAYRNHKRLQNRELNSPKP